MKEYKPNLEPSEWYGYKREHPREYRRLMEYVKDASWLAPVTINGRTVCELIIPRKWFSFGTMLCFLTYYRHLKEYKRINFTEALYQGRETVGIKPSVYIKSPCDYFWSEVTAVLAIMVSCEKGE